MTRALVVILLSTLSYWQECLSQEQRNENTPGWVEVLFSHAYFEKEFYKHNHIEKEGFFIKDNNVTRELHSLSRGLFDLQNGFFVSIVAEGYLFAWNIGYYIVVDYIQVSENAVDLNYTLMEHKGRNAEIMCKRRVRILRHSSDWAVEPMEN